MSSDLHKLARAMCSLDLAESQWTQELPRLPVPDLWLTVSRYLASLKSVLAPSSTLDELLDDSRQLELKLSREERRANWQQYERTDQLVKLFMLNEGPELQRDLKEYANKCQNWATEFWLQDMYLSNPLPLPVNSNPFFLFPRQKFANSNEMLMFATRIIQFSVDFKFRIDQQALHQDYGSGHGKGKALCMETYKNFFHSYRMPHESMDRLLPQSRRSNHIVVASCNQFYILRLGQDPLDNPYRKDLSSQLNESSIFEQLLRIYRVSREHARRETGSGGRGKIVKVGLLTSENRKQWARLHKKLCHCVADSGAPLPVGSGSELSRSGAQTPNCNTESLRLIEDCLFVMCLDSLVHTSESEVVGARTSGPEEEEVRAANVILTGGGSHLFTGNRWFDKFLQIIVGRNGICGINIEHSVSEGITVLRFLEEFLSFIKLNPINNSGASEQTSSNKFTYATSHGGGDNSSNHNSITSPNYVEPKSPSVLLEESDNITPLVWHLDDELELAISDSERRANELIESFSLEIMKFTHFGRHFIKSQNLSPDAFIQLALQLTFYKLHGRLVSTYESASLRQFRLGRVDNIRANTCEAYQWIQSMLWCKKRLYDEDGTTTNANKETPYSEAEGPFIKAITKQVEILRYTIIGSGPDNHLLALRELAKLRYGTDEMPQLFTDDSYKEFLNFRLSTSQLPNESGILVGYGAVVPDGYGASYNPCEDKIIFCISSFKSTSMETSTSKFVHALEESLLEMRQVCLGQAKNSRKLVK